MDFPEEKSIAGVEEVEEGTTPKPLFYLFVGVILLLVLFIIGLVNWRSEKNQPMAVSQTPTSATAATSIPVKSSPSKKSKKPLAVPTAKPKPQRELATNSLAVSELQKLRDDLADIRSHLLEITVRLVSSEGNLPVAEQQQSQPKPPPLRSRLSDKELAGRFWQEYLNQSEP